MNLYCNSVLGCFPYLYAAHGKPIIIIFLNELFYQFDDGGFIVHSDFVAVGYNGEAVLVRDSQT